jgi:hypothetical protein
MSYSKVLVKHETYFGSVNTKYFKFVSDVIEKVKDDIQLNIPDDWASIFLLTEEGLVIRP